MISGAWNSLGNRPPATHACSSSCESTVVPASAAASSSHWPAASCQERAAASRSAGMVSGMKATSRDSTRSMFSGYQVAMRSCAAATRSPLARAVSGSYGT